MLQRGGGRRVETRPGSVETGTGPTWQKHLGNLLLAGNLGFYICSLIYAMGRLGYFLSACMYLVAERGVREKYLA